MGFGLLFALLAGSLVSVQNIFNSKVSARTGSGKTTVLVLALGFLASFTIGLLSEGSGFFRVGHMEPWYYFSGILGVGVVVCLTQGVNRLGPTFAIAISLSSQLIFALLLDSMGWFGLERVPFTARHLVGVLVILCGILLFKWSGNRKTAAVESSELTV
ncbi:DMT family transporter [Gorillibacterium massiliense]|uniref:DMT family transporter n=1 Tax=Gorillibacterium massiliense TaxID=1280390 RepID=UPI0004B59948|nr:DMT family transporter [Gorillibacterium massiliense]